MSRYIVSLYISKRVDVDLMEIIQQVTPSVFNKITKYALKSLFDSSYITQAKNMYLDSIRKGKGAEEEITTPKESVVIRLSITKADDENIRYLLSKIKLNKKSAFIKQVIRYVLGPEIIYPVYLLTDAILRSETYTHLLLDGMTPPSTTKRIYKRKRPSTSIKKRQEKQEIEEKPVSSVSTNIPLYPETLPIYKEEEEVKEEKTTSLSEEEDMLALLNNILS